MKQGVGMGFAQFSAAGDSCSLLNNIVYKTDRTATKGLHR